MTLNADLSTTKAELERAQAGIRSPRVVTLSAGEALFRFASTKNQKTGESIPSDRWALGPWWVQEEDYHKILARFQDGQMGFGTIARAALAVQPSWSNMDVSVKAVLLQDVNVYVGRGATQYHDVLPNGMHVTLTGWPDITQVYVPNLRDLAPQALRVIRKKIITTDPLGF
jgi:hypothetical protein